MKNIERNPVFTNRLIDSASLYLRQHAHNPVFWYPWGREAIDRARAENKPILLSIGYSSCYWCHVMEREIFENPSIAALMNESFVNIKIDREEYPQLDEIYMVARQLLRSEGGWPNNVFLTPQLEPFYAGGTYAAEDTPRRASFPRLLEWINHTWMQNQEKAREIAARVVSDMQPHLVYQPSQATDKTDVSTYCAQLFAAMQKHYDTRSGGFFQAPKFPNECYLQFLLAYFESTKTVEALDMAVHTLSKMAAGGLYDQVGCGFHRYAIDKEWYIPHFEKMLYNQAQLARLYTDAARLTGNPWLADIARSILDFVGGPMTSGTGGFYAAIDAQTDGVEGAHYAWSAEELKKVLSADELTFLTTFYALADIPHFEGHKHVQGQVLIARKPMDLAARDYNIPYTQLAAMCGELMNKLLPVRNLRAAPALDDKILVSWNGLMIDAFAHAGRVFNRPSYTARAREAADFILNKCFDNEGNLKHVYAGGRAYLGATLEDYVFLTKGLLSLWRAAPDDELVATAKALMERVEELFSDAGNGYFYAQANNDVIIRTKSADDSAIAGANGVLLHNLLAMYDITKEAMYRQRADALVAFFVESRSQTPLEYATIMSGAMRLCDPPLNTPNAFVAGELVAPDDVVAMSAHLFPADAAPGSHCEVIVTLDIKDGWHINAHHVSQPYLIPTQLDIHGAELLGIDFPQAIRMQQEDNILVYKGLITATARIRLPRGERQTIKIMLRFQPCHATTCHAVSDLVLSL
jgi:uncharacterized protein